MTRESDTHAERGDAMQAPSERMGSAAPSGVRPNSTTSTTSQHTDLISRLSEPYEQRLSRWPELEREAAQALSDLTTQRDELIEGRDYYAGRYADKCGETIVLTAERDKLREALRFYASEQSYRHPPTGGLSVKATPISCDKGERARTALTTEAQ